MMSYRTLCACALAVAPLTAFAHHGVASLGAAGLEGPGAPIETSSSATLPEGKWLAYLKIDHADFETGILPAGEEEGEYSQFWMAGLGYGFTPWFSGYLFQPYNIKTFNTDDDTSGLADLSLMGVVGFKYDDGFRLVPASESLDDLEDWHFTVYFGSTVPTGRPNVKVGGVIDPGKALGFGVPSYTVGFTATKQLNERLTSVYELARTEFDEYEYDDGQTMRFGSETRLNAALAWRAYMNGDTRTRVDFNLEGNYLALGKDRADGVDDAGSGGRMLYLVPGVRAYFDDISVGVALKRPVWTDLNHEDEQQGAEGKEDYRLILTFSAMF